MVHRRAWADQWTVAGTNWGYIIKNHLISSNIIACHSTSIVLVFHDQNQYIIWSKDLNGHREWRLLCFWGKYFLKLVWPSSPLELLAHCSASRALHCLWHNMVCINGIGLIVWHLPAKTPYSEHKARRAWTIYFPCRKCDKHRMHSLHWILLRRLQYANVAPPQGVALQHPPGNFDGTMNGAKIGQMKMWSRAFQWVPERSFQENWGVQTVVPHDFQVQYNVVFCRLSFQVTLPLDMTAGPTFAQARTGGPHPWEPKFHGTTLPKNRYMALVQRNVFCSKCPVGPYNGNGFGCFGWLKFQRPPD